MSTRARSSKGRSGRRKHTLRRGVSDTPSDGHGDSHDELRSDSGKLPSKSESAASPRDAAVPKPPDGGAEGVRDASGRWKAGATGNVLGVNQYSGRQSLQREAAGVITAGKTTRGDQKIIWDRLVALAKKGDSWAQALFWRLSREGGGEAGPELTSDEDLVKRMVEARERVSARGLVAAQTVIQVRNFTGLSATEVEAVNEIRRREGRPALPPLDAEPTNEDTAVDDGSGRTNGSPSGSTLEPSAAPTSEPKPTKPRPGSWEIDRYWEHPPKQREAKT